MLLHSAVRWPSGSRGASRFVEGVECETASPRVVHTDIPFRLDRLPWSRFHLLMVIALGITWVLDGLEVTIVGSIGPALQSRQTLGLFECQCRGRGVALRDRRGPGSALLGLADRPGGSAAGVLCHALYLSCRRAAECALLELCQLRRFRLLTGFGIGGEYAAVNSAIDELIPAKYRGRVDLIVNGSFWVGAASGALGSLVLLDPHLIRVQLGWRLGFAIGGVLGLSVLLLRRWVPESPRWLVTHCRGEEANRIVNEIESHVQAHRDSPLPAAHGTHARAPTQGVRTRHHFPLHGGYAPSAQHSGVHAHGGPGVSL